MGRFLFFYIDKRVENVGKYTAKAIKVTNAKNVRQPIESASPNSGTLMGCHLFYGASYRHAAGP